MPSADIVDLTNFWLWFGRVADILGVISFVISIITLFVTAGIKKAQRQQVEKSDYSVDIENQLETLKAYHDLAAKSDKFDDSLALELQENLICIETYYETLLPKKLKSDIKGLKNYLENSMGKPPYSKGVCKELAKRLTLIMARLKKVKKLL